MNDERCSKVKSVRQIRIVDSILISIVIVNWNSGRLLQSCVQSLLQHAPECQIVVVDNASTDSSLLFVEEIHASAFSIVRNRRNAGFAEGNNIGWRRSEGDRILFMNPDIECQPESIACLERTLDADPGIWAVGGHLVSPSGQSQANYNVRAFPSFGNVAAEMLFMDALLPSRRQARRAAAQSAAVDVDQPAAACLMVEKAALDKVGGFDEDFRPAWFEDVDLCRRIRDCGGRIQYQPLARFLHHGGYSLQRIARQDFLEIFHANQIRYFRKHNGARAAARIRILIVLGLILRSVLSTAASPIPSMTRSAAAKMFWKAARRISSLPESRS